MNEISFFLGILNWKLIKSVFKEWPKIWKKLKKKKKSSQLS